ncbi:hypothetical protein IV203_031799 [Nitzschia inconspicua]|uniref:Uncharacterized protein n=1 Tax=Nitzschia inconspicua TaxID=303405 RepID=A0A9K3Q2Y8_9STRA|nr:hypothetical protein IV203_031799 [Nitzschia inconspicua]
MKSSSNHFLVAQGTSTSRTVVNHGHQPITSSHQHLRPNMHIAPKPSPGSETVTTQNHSTLNGSLIERSFVPSNTTQEPTANTNNDSATIMTISESSAPPCRQSFNKTIWYLGGNHAAKLLTSVDGDLDPDMLANLAAVPAVIGELALSVESLVSDDCTVGGFEMDILAKIAANTLNGRKQAIAIASKEETKSSPCPTTISPPSPPPAQESRGSEAETVSSPVAFPGSVPNPLLENYDPVPNPLARITPPGSPTPAVQSGVGINKRKELPSGEEYEHINKVIRTCDGPGVIEAR